MTTLASDAARLPRGPVRVMIVDDSAIFRSAARALIGVCDGLELVVEAASGEEALDAREAARPDLVLLDVSMPGIGGVETCRRLVLADPGLTIVLLSADDYDWSAHHDCAPTVFLPKSELSAKTLTACLEAVRR